MNIVWVWKCTLNSLKLRDGKILYIVCDYRLKQSLRVGIVYWRVPGH